MLTIYIIPVGETDHSRSGELLGINDVPLNPVGLSLAGAFSDVLKPTVIEAIFSGPMKRQLFTARKIAKPHNLPVRIERGLLDINYGSWSGLTWPRIMESSSDEYSRFIGRPSKFRFPSGEKMKRCWKRTSAFSHSVLENFGVGHLVIVADDAIGALLISQMTGIALEEIKPWCPSNGKMSLLASDEKRVGLKVLRGEEWGRR